MRERQREFFFLKGLTLEPLETCDKQREERQIGAPKIPAIPFLVPGACYFKLPEPPRERALWRFALNNQV